MLRKLMAVVLAFVGSNIIFELVDLRYAPFRDRLDPPRLAFDIGVWVVCFVLASWLLRPRAPAAAGS